LTERRYAVDCERQHFRERIFRLAREPFVAVVLDADLIVADPTHEAADETVRLARAFERIDDAPAHQPEIARIDGDRHVGETARDAIEQARRHHFEGAFTAARAARRIDDVVARAPLLDERGDEFGRVLQIAVHQDDRIAKRRIQSRRRGELMAEVSREIDDDQA